MQQTPPPALSRAAFAYLASIVAAAAAAAAAAVVLGGPGSRDWTVFALLTVGASFAPSAPARPGSNAFVQTAGAFLVAAAVLLPPGLVAAVAAVSYAAAWSRCRVGPREALFNAANMVGAALASWAVFHAASGPGGALHAAAAGAACVAFVIVNHGALAVVLRLADGGRAAASLVLQPESLLTALGVAATGVCAALLWQADPWTLPFALLPLLLVQRGFAVPHLQEEASLDPKTGLFNARRFADALADEVERAGRQSRPLSVLMVDLDFLREINNAHGHLAGDEVLTAVAAAIRENVREGDVACRFGGEEFGILLPATGRTDALEVARRIRAAVEAREIRVETIPEPLHATVSVGVACYPADAVDARSLVHAADLGLYRAKNEGRNRVVYAGAAAPA